MMLWSPTTSQAGDHNISPKQRHLLLRSGRKVHAICFDGVVHFANTEQQRRGKATSGCFNPYDCVGGIGDLICRDYGISRG